ncbi:MAG: hypothetical protein AB7P76_02385 [Candidatus Melainabacteria bacterium]
MGLDYAQPFTGMANTPQPALPLRKGPRFNPTYDGQFAWATTTDPVVNSLTSDVNAIQELMYQDSGAQAIKEQQNALISGNGTVYRQAAGIPPRPAFTPGYATGGLPVPGGPSMSPYYNFGQPPAQMPGVSLTRPLGNLTRPAVIGGLGAGAGLMAAKYTSLGGGKAALAGGALALGAAALTGHLSSKPKYGPY